MPFYRTQSNRNLSSREESLVRKISEMETQLEEQRLSYEKAEEDFKDKELQKIKVRIEVPNTNNKFSRFHFRPLVFHLAINILSDSSEIFLY